MITPELRQFVAQAMAAGQSVDDIRKNLREQGWESLDIEQALVQANQAPVAPKPSGWFPSVFELIRGAFRLYRSRAKALLTVAVVAGVLLTVGQWLGYGSVSVTSSFRSDGMTFPGGIVAIIAYAIAMVAYAYTWFAGIIVVVRPDVVSLQQAIAEVPRKFLPMLWVTILSSAVIMGGFIFVLIPGLIFAMWFSFTLYVYLSQNISGLQALRLSKEYVRGFFWRVAWSFFAFGVLAAIVCAIVIVLIMGLAVVTGPIGFIFSLLLDVLMVAAVILYTAYCFQVFLALQTRKGILTDAPKATAPIVIGLIGLVIIIILAVSDTFASKPEQGALNALGISSQTDIRRVFELAAVKAAIEMYQDEKGSYPATLSELSPDYLSRELVDVAAFTYTSTGATYQVCTTVGGQQACEQPEEASTAPVVAP
jgi:hypothetical protein